MTGTKSNQLASSPFQLHCTSRHLFIAFSAWGPYTIGFKILNLLNVDMFSWGRSKPPQALRTVHVLINFGTRLSPTHGMHVAGP